MKCKDCSENPERITPLESGQEMWGHCDYCGWPLDDREGEEKYD